jgi:hypothetical protein
MLTQVLAEFRAEAPVLAGSAAVVLVMVGAAWALGFRAKARLSDADLARLAEAEGARVEGAVIAPDARAAFACLSNGKVMVARVMGDDLSARAAPAASVRVALTPGRLDAVFADIGFPPLHMKLEETPPWLAALAQGQGRS